MIVNKNGLTFDVDPKNGISVTHVNSSKLSAPVFIDGVDSIDELLIMQGVNPNGEVSDRYLKVCTAGSDSGVIFNQFESGDVEIFQHLIEDGTLKRKFIRFDIVG